jgi:PepSY-associated TM region/Peptidase propeptide and YPEB domain
MTRTFARWHIWLGWLIAVPLILWTASGLWMVARPIEEVRGEALRRAGPPLPAGLTPVFADKIPAGTHKIELVMRVDRPIWVVHGHDGAMHVVDAATGTMLPEVDAALARRISDAALVSPSAVVSVQRFAADANPVELRRGRPAWRVRYSDNVHVYVDAQSGAVLAVRTRQWRIFDFMWGLHIMDLEEREDSSHPLLILFAALALIGVLFGTILLFRRRRAALPSSS